MLFSAPDFRPRRTLFVFSSGEFSRSLASLTPSYRFRFVNPLFTRSPPVLTRSDILPVSAFVLFIVFSQTVFEKFGPPSGLPFPESLFFYLSVAELVTVPGLTSSRDLFDSPVFLFLVGGSTRSPPAMSTLPRISGSCRSGTSPFFSLFNSWDTQPFV